MLDEGIIKESAHRHGIDDDDIRHALRWVIDEFFVFGDDERPLTMVVGTTWSGSLIEVGLNASGEIVHAMGARRAFLRAFRRR